MKEQQFEKSLKEQPFRPIPGAWKQQLLVQARQSSATAISPGRFGGSPAEGIALAIQRLRALLWPNPLAWGALAALWICILAVNLSVGRVMPTGPATAAAPARVIATTFKEQEKLLAELIEGPGAQAKSAKPVVSPLPRSERREEFFRV